MTIREKHNPISLHELGGWWCQISQCTGTQREAEVRVMDDEQMVMVQKYWAVKPSYLYH